ncbi:hypothetical protein [Nocardia thraciensis]
MGLAPVRNDHEKLTKELEDVRKRGVFRVFQRLDKQGSLEIPTLSRIVAMLCPDLWNGGHRDEALASVLKAAMGQLPHGSLPESHSDMSWQQAALIMYQIVPLPSAQIRLVESQYSRKQEYVKRARYVQDYALPPDDGDAISRLNSQIKRQLAAVLLENEIEVGIRKDSRVDAESATADAERSVGTSDASETATDDVQQEADVSNASSEAAESVAEAPIPGMGSMTVNITSAGQVTAGPHAFQIIHNHK